MNSDGGLRTRMAEFGLHPTSIIWDGQIHRFRTEGDDGSDRSGAGWYRAFPDRRGAVFGNWRTGVEEGWQSRAGRESPGALAELRAQWSAQREEWLVEEERKRAEAAKEAQRRWEAAQPPDPHHPYAVAKQIDPVAARLKQDGDLLLAPLKDFDTNGVVSLQTITPDGEKRFLPGGRVKGTRMSIGGRASKDVIYVTEGIATGVTIHAATGAPVVVAFCASNLDSVALKLRQRYPDARLIVACDNDRWTSTPRGRNPGVLAGRAAALVAGAEVAIPSFAGGCTDPSCSKDCGLHHGTDFNDLAAEEDIRAVRRWLDPARADKAVTWIDLGGGPQAQAPPSTSDDADPDSAAWPDTPIIPGPPEPVRLPLEVLPPSLRDQVGSVAASMQVPEDIPLLLALACASAAVGGKVEVVVRLGWREPVSLYVAIIYLPAGRKSPTYAIMTEPLRERESECIRDATPSLLAAQDVVEVAERALADAKTAAAKKKGSLDDVENARKELEAARASMPPDGRLLAGDITPEAMVQRMASQGGRLAILEPEPGPLQLIAGRYSDTARLDEVKKAWSGETITVDRVGRPPLRVERPALTLALMLQPGVLEGLQNAAAFRYEGVLGRVLWCRPRHRLGKRLTGLDVPPFDLGAADRYRRALRRLLKMRAAGAADGSDPPTLSLSPEALSSLHAWEAEVERELADGGRYAGIRDWAGKMVGQTVRVAALLELASRAQDGRPLLDEPIGMWALEGAIRLLRALGSHALAVLSGDLGMDSRMRLLRYVLQRAVAVVRRMREAQEEATERELFRACQGHASINEMSDLRPLIGALEERGCLRLVRRPSTGGRTPSPRLEVHPVILDQEVSKRTDESDGCSTGHATGEACVTSVHAFAEVPSGWEAAADPEEGGLGGDPVAAVLEGEP